MLTYFEHLQQANTTHYKNTKLSSLLVPRLSSPDQQEICGILHLMMGVRSLTDDRSLSRRSHFPRKSRSVFPPAPGDSVRNERLRARGAVRSNTRNVSGTWSHASSFLLTDLSWKCVGDLSFSLTAVSNYKLCPTATIHKIRHARRD